MGKRELRIEHQESAPKARGILNAIRVTITWLLVIAAVAMMVFTVISVNTFDRNDRNLFGYKAFIIRSDSMSKTDFSAGDLIIVKKVDPTTLTEGDIIAFQSTAIESYGETITHKIRTLTTTSDGVPGFITYGTTTDTNDINIVTYSYVIGKHEVTIPYVGTFFQFLKTTQGYILCILLPFLLLIAIQGFNTIRLAKQYRAEQHAELAAERKEIAAERKRLEEERQRSEQALEELKRLSATLDGPSASP